jgi:hypothetical protein
MDISGLDKIKLLNALWENMVPASFFTMMGLPSPGFDEKKAEEAVKGYIDYFCGRAIKMDLSQDKVDPWLYNRDTKTPAEEVVKKLRLLE